MPTDPRSSASSRAAWLLALVLVPVACGQPGRPSPLPDAPRAPAGWTTIGAVGGEAAPGRAVSRLAFSGRPVAVNGRCRGNGTLFVVVGWRDVSASTGPAEFRTAVFPCQSPAEAPNASRLELAEAPTGDAEVAAFIVEDTGGIGRSTFMISIEEQDP